MQTQTVFLVLILHMHHQLKSLSQRSFHALLKKDGETGHLRANVAKNQTISKYCGNSSKINSAHILMLGSP